MSSPTPPTPSKVLSVFFGVLAAFASFALGTALFQWLFGGSSTPEKTHEERVVIKQDVAKEQHDLIVKYGLDGNPLPVYEKIVPQLKSREVKATTILDPKSPTAKKAAAEAEAKAKAEEEAKKAAEGDAKEEPKDQQPAPAPAPSPAPAPAPAAEQPAPAPAPAAPAPQPEPPAPAPAPAAPAPDAPPATAPAPTAQ